MKEACENCRYVARNHETSLLLTSNIVYTCRRLPPVMIVTTDFSMVAQPKVAKDAWCGEYAPQEAEADES